MTTNTTTGQPKPSSDTKKPLLLWTDIETTGLGPSASIIQLGMVVTDGDLNVIAEFEEVVRHTDANRLYWDAPAYEMHKKTGLLKEIETARLDTHQVSVRAASFIQNYCNLPTLPDLTVGGVKPFMAGSSVHFDHMKLTQFMPRITELCHYRLLDVSVFKVLGAVWGIDALAKPPDSGEVKHTALADIHGSIGLLRYYLDTLAINVGRDLLEWKQIDARDSAPDLTGLLAP